LDGKQKISVEKVVPIQEWKKLGYSCAQEILENGGKEIMEVLRKTLKPKY
jgi:hydroxymethylbilane synthase